MPIPDRLLSREQTADLARQTRTDAGLTLAQVAEQLGVSLQAVHRAETVTTAAHDDLRARIVALAGHSLDGPLFYLRRRPGPKPGSQTADADRA